MHFPQHALFLGLFASIALGGSLRIINNNKQCMVWSEDNYGCTGSSAPFAKLDGKDCSDHDTVKLDICGTKDGQQLAWVDVDKKGTVSFLNIQGNTFTCALDNKFMMDSKCDHASASTSSASSRSSTPISSQLRTSISISQSSAPASTLPAACSCVLVVV
ncbi:uncharacterized protein N7443_001761 [Penicillium atrosanguineum]|uniref:Uncharacterized protein n=1 Tax=Penicillium atrosanguineum TaxID=1132637 RepID=A0A9W9PZ02_9EURO|nr:uncharacterized protein N7443_001761 [Penicillium atrosanguineum]KAJ5117854.1 hypothetical protein N7526_010877 [Penicillium atrosanguineum]KAJ5309300.1 hypothetical protein N7443_001761 [Penicillium atrosanguineum]KAJ5318562.1 hypothetical protein N7476_004982 [Penicillium atrosanguineum]